MAREASLRSRVALSSARARAEDLAVSSSTISGMVQERRASRADSVSAWCSFLVSLEVTSSWARVSSFCVVVRAVAMRSAFS